MLGEFEASGVCKFGQWSRKVGALIRIAMPMTDVRCEKTLPKADEVPVRVRRENMGWVFKVSSQPDIPIVCQWILQD